MRCKPITCKHVCTWLTDKKLVSARDHVSFQFLRVVQLTTDNFTFKLFTKSFSSWEASLENKNVFNAVLAAENIKIKTKKF